MQLGDCIIVPDGRIGRVRALEGDKVKVRLMRTTSHTHQFIWYQQSELVIVACPKGWMSQKGYKRYLEITLKKMNQRRVKEYEK